MPRELALIAMLFTASAAMAFDTNQLGQRAPLLLRGIVQLIGQSVELQTEVNAALNELGKTADEVMCSGRQFPGQWTNLAGMRAAPYVCNFTTKWLSINATVIVADSKGEVYETITPEAIEYADKITEKDPTWRWTTQPPAQVQSRGGVVGATIVPKQEPEKAKRQDPCGWLGITVSPMTASFAESLGMVDPYGAIFDRPEPGSPAANEHIEQGDVITAINGSPLATWKDFTPTIAAMAPGTTLYLTTYRDGQLTEVKVVLGSSKCPS